MEHAGRKIIILSYMAAYDYSESNYVSGGA